MGKRLQERQVSVRLKVRTHLDDSDLERRIVDFISPEALHDSLEGLGERIDLMETDVTVEPSGELPALPSKRGTKAHEWAEHSRGARTVCGLTVFRHGRTVVDDLGAVELKDRCASCERMRSAIGTSRTLEARS